MGQVHESGGREARERAACAAACARANVRMYSATKQAQSARET
jgi:hypothetical protein